MFHHHIYIYFVLGTFEDRSDEFKNTQSLITDLDQKVSSVLGEVHKLNEKRSHLRNLLQQIQTDRESFNNQYRLLENSLDRQNKLVSTLTSTIKQSNDKITSLSEEMKSELRSGLSAADQKSLTELEGETGELQQDLLEAGNDRSTVESEKTVLENMLSTNLVKRQQELSAALESSAGDVAQEELDTAKHSLLTIEQSLQDISAQRTSLDKSVSKANSALKQETNRLDKLNSQEIKEKRDMAKESKQLEQLLHHKARYLQKIEDCQKQIRDLGTLPSEAFSKYNNWNDNKLMSTLEKTSTKLKKYSHVNKKAIDQYSNFTTQREELLERKAELDEGNIYLYNISVMHIFLMTT